MDSIHQTKPQEHSSRINLNHRLENRPFHCDSFRNFQTVTKDAPIPLTQNMLAGYKYPRTNYTKPTIYSARSKPSYPSTSAYGTTAGAPSSSSGVIFEKATRTKYYLGPLLGKGGFAKCYQVTEAITGKKYAIKQIDKNSLKKEKTREKLGTEIKIHSSLKDDYVCSFERYFEDNDFVYILLELCKCNSMMDLLKSKRRLSETETRYLLFQLLQGIKYMHKQQVIHRDLKLGNLFMDCNSFGEMKLRIGDFGLATQLDYPGQRKKTICGTPNYIAPEILTAQSRGHSYEVDIWSFGVILYTCIIGKPPFETTHVKTTYRKIKKNQYSFPIDKKISNEAKSLIQVILSTNPTDRPSVEDILEHPFFANHNCTECPPGLTEYCARKTGKTFYKHKPATLANEYTPREARVPLQPVQLNNNKYDAKPSKYATLLDKENIKPDSNPVITVRKASPPPKARQGNRVDMEQVGKVDEVDLMCENIAKSFQALHVSPPNEKENLPHPDLWIREYSDFSAKYGLAYRFNNGIVGAFFNDCTKLLWHPRTDEVEYVTRGQGPNKTVERNLYSIENYPADIKKKIVLIKYFKASFDKKREFPIEQLALTPALSTITSNIYVKMWVKTSHAYVFRLSNRTVQVCFNDRSEIILTCEATRVTYTNRLGDKKTFSLNSVNMMNYKDQALSKRLKYVKECLFSLISKRKK